MKKIALLAVFAIMFAACSKQDDVVNNNNSSEVRATITYSGSPAMDGYGWVLRLTADSFEIPTNLPEAFQQENQLVSVSYVKTDKTFPCRCTVKRNMVDIISIRKVSATGQ